MVGEGDDDDVGVCNDDDDDVGGGDRVYNKDIYYFLNIFMGGFFIIFIFVSIIMWV